VMPFGIIFAFMLLSTKGHDFLPGCRM